MAAAAPLAAACGGDEEPERASPPERGEAPQTATEPPPATEPPARTPTARDGDERATRHAAFVALEDEDAVAVLRGPPWRLIRTVPVPSGPHNATASGDGRFVAVSSPPANRVTIRPRGGA